jgi:methionyl-tRNA synthetase
MWIQRLDPQRFVRAYDIQCQALYPWSGVVETPFGASWARVSPGESTKRHAHQDGETFFIARGSGSIRIGDEEGPVQAGDVVYLPPFDEHTLTNTSATLDLLFLTIYWEDRAEWTKRTLDAGRAAGAGKRAMVTAAPPTPNGDLHLGHLSGPYLAGDVLTRYLVLRGVDAHYVCGTDDNQSYVTTKANQLGLTPAATADRMAEAIERTLRAARVELRSFVRPNASAFHAPMVERLFRRLHEDGALIAREALCAYCEACEKYLFEAHVKGRCPHCGAASGGNSCEDCGRPNDCADLIDPSCTRCGAPAERRPFTRLYFPLGRYADEIRRYHESVSMPPHLRSLCEQALSAGLPDIAISHVTDWGLPVPAEGYEDQRLYAWFEMAPRYLAYAEGLSHALGAPGGWERFWRSEEAEITQCFGFDNGFFYAVFIPALLRAYDPGIRLPTAFVMNEFYRLDGLKFSTSRGHAIWGRDLLGEVPADMVRFYLAYTCPETEGTNFTREDFEVTVERELCSGLEPWLRELAAKVRREAQGKAPAPGDWTVEHRRFYERLTEIAGDAAVAYEAKTFSPQRAARALTTLVREARRFGKAEDHWRKVPGRREERRQSLALELLAAKTLAIMASPLMPDFGARLLRDLGYVEPLAAVRWEDQPIWIPGGQAVGDLGAGYFPSVAGTLDARRRPAARAKDPVVVVASRND